MSTLGEVGFDEFVGKAGNRTMTQRAGQNAMCLLNFIRPDLYRRIMSECPEADPFYDDGNLTAFWSFLEGHWREPEDRD